MADGEKAATKTEAPKTTASAAAPRKTKLVAETGRFVCKHPITYLTADGQRAHAKAGEVVSIHEKDVPALKRKRVIENEEETAEG